MSTMQRETGAGVPYVDSTGLDYHEEISQKVDRVAREISGWMEGVRNKPSLYNRTSYVAPDDPYKLMSTAKQAVENDDIISGVCDVTEGLMWQGVKWESDDADDADIFNQINRDLNLDEFARQWHREEYTYSQVIVGIWWGRKSYTVRGKGKGGRKRRSTKELVCPVAITFLDPQRVVPLPPGPFGQDRLCWHATEEEYATVVAGSPGFYGDSVMDEFLTGPVAISSQSERMQLVSWGINPDRLVGLNQSRVFRYCRTKSDYERFASVRLKSTFPLLDIKQQLMEADRINLVGAANYILLVRQGTKEEPAKQEELDNLNENFKVVAKLPVVIADHRLSIDIITPNQEQVLSASKYDTIDRRIMGRALGALSVASSGQRNESTVTIARSVSRLLESRRHMFKRMMEEYIARATVEHPANVGKFDGEPNLAFTPRNVQIDTDAEVAKAILTLRTQNELSRESTLEYFGFDQAVEALRREFEEESGMDDVFQTRIPFNSPDNNGEPPQVSGARGGRPTGGGESKQSPQGQSGKRTSTGNPSTGGA